jgi:hypothetical protein
MVASLQRRSAKSVRRFVVGFRLRNRNGKHFTERLAHFGMLNLMKTKDPC